MIISYIGFYGTLSYYTGPALEYSHDDVIPDGMLWDLGAYPGYQPAYPSDALGRDISVRVFYIKNPIILFELDQYEGVPNLYKRVVINSSKGEHFNFYTYELVKLPSSATLITEGEWTKWS